MGFFSKEKASGFDESDKLKDRYLLVKINVAAGLVSLFLPLIGYFHYDSAVLFSVIGSVEAVWFTARNKLNHKDLAWLGLSIFLAGLPLALSDAVQGWFTFDGLAYWLVIPIWSVLLAAALTRFVKQFSTHAGILTGLIVLIVAVIPTLAELLTQPKVYFFNPVWGYFPGPIYDEALPFDSRLIFYRMGTLGWIGLLWLLPSQNKSRTHSLLMTLSGLIAVSSWLFYGMLGITRSEENLGKHLDSHYRSGEVAVYFDSSYTDSSDVWIYAELANIYIKRNKQTLDVDDSLSIRWYLYPDPWIKKTLVGAKYTQFVPVWLKQDQIHVDETMIIETLEHELVHVLAKQWTSNILGASWSIGLTEGLAKAREIEWSSPNTNSELVASRKQWPTLTEVEDLLSVMGFYRLNSGQAYTTAGAFLEFAFAEKSVSDIRKAYNQSSPGILTGPETDERWESYLKRQKVDTLSKQRAERIFSGLSIFEKSAPRVITPFEHVLDKLRLFNVRGQREKAITLLEKSIEGISSDQQNYLNSILAQYYLLEKEPENVLNIKEVKQSLSLSLLKTDAQIMMGDSVAAGEMLEKLRSWDIETDAQERYLEKQIKQREQVENHAQKLFARYGYWDKWNLNEETTAEELEDGLRRAMRMENDTIVEKILIHDMNIQQLKTNDALTYDVAIFLKKKRSLELGHHWLENREMYKEEGRQVLKSFLK